MEVRGHPTDVWVRGWDSGCQTRWQASLKLTPQLQKWIWTKAGVRQVWRKEEERTGWVETVRKSTFFYPEKQANRVCVWGGVTAGLCHSERMVN